MKQIVVSRVINSEKQPKNPIGIAIGSGNEISNRRRSGIGGSIAATEDGPVSLTSREEKWVGFGVVEDGRGGERGATGGGGDGEKENEGEEGGGEDNGESGFGVFEGDGSGRGGGGG